MAENTKIEWADHTFNPWEGCTKVSPGCANCYAEARNHRYGLDNWGKGKPRRRTSEANWRKPARWDREAAGDLICLVCGSDEPNQEGFCSKCELKMDIRYRPRVFCASLADWLDDEVPIEWLADLLKLIHDTPNLDWLLLTKRPENWRSRLTNSVPLLMDNKPDVGNWVCDWLGIPSVFQPYPPSNVWIGTTVENQEQEERVSHLLKIPAKVRFLSCEPLLGAVDLTLRGLPGWDEDWKLNALTGKEWANPRDDSAPPANAPRIHWVICGGESGPNARPMHPEWARSLRDQCQAADVPFFFKQWGEWAPSCAQYPANEEEEKESELAGNYGDIALEPSGVIVHGYQPISKRTWLMNRVGKKSAGRLLDGREWNEFPVVGGGK